MLFRMHYSAALLLLLWISCMLQVMTQGFNIDYEYTVLKNGPVNSLFGFSVAEHQNEKISWLLVGAPLSNSTFYNYKKSGAVFKCDPTRITTSCEELKFDYTGPSEFFSSDEQFFGVTLKSGGKNRHIVSCANRFKSYGASKGFILHEGKCFVLYSDFKYNGEIRSCAKHNSIGGNYDTYGQCMSGTGMDILSDSQQENQHYVGAPGSLTGLGKIFGVGSDLDNDIENVGKIANATDSYFGYSITNGNFFEKTVTSVATAGPRHNSLGTVLLLTKDLVTVKQALPSKTDQGQIGSGFGAALCSIDSDSDGLDELVVGASFYSHDSLRANQGRVYIYALKAGKSELELLRAIDATLHGVDRAEGSFFGQALANGGDLNLDGYEDLVVGAPHDNNGDGAIYIYQGSEMGLTKNPTQIIRASSIHSGLNNNIGLKGFGRSLGTGLDMDQNGYNDIVVGAYASNQAVLLRSRPVINVRIRVSFTPKELKVNKDCLIRGVQTTCFDMNFCFNFTEPSQKVYMKDDDEIPLQYTILADPIKKPRVRFPSGSSRHKFIEKTFKTDRCVEFKKLYLVFNSEGVVPEFPDIAFEIKYFLPYGDGIPKPSQNDQAVVSLDRYPSLKELYKDGERVQYHQLSFELKFERECTICVPDLQLISETNFTFGLGRESFAYLATIRNNGKDPAYALGLSFNFSKDLSLESVNVKNEKSLVCSGYICEDIHNKLARNEEIVLEITLNTKEFKPDTHNMFSMTAFSINQDDPNTVDDNMVTVSLELKVEADIQLLLGKSTLQVVYSGKAIGETAVKKMADIGDVVDHKYIVRNNGPDLLPSSELTISWPFETKSGKHLLYLVDIVTTKATTICKTPQKNILNLQDVGSRGDVIDSKYQARVSRDLESKMRQRRSINVTEIPFTTSKTKTIAPTSEAGNETPTEKQVRKKEGVVLDCSSARCISISCKFTDMASGSNEAVTIRSRLWQASLVIDHYGDVLTVVSKAQVTTGTNLTFIVDPNIDNNKGEVYTNINPDFPAKKKEQKIWVYIVAAVVGVVLLVLLVFGLYKLGFFKRQRVGGKYEPKSKNKESKKLVK